ncbi:FRIGIDA-like protein [Tanacetum coccineum]
MSDSASGDSDVQDFKDLDMIFELALLEQQQQEEAERAIAMQESVFIFNFNRRGRKAFIDDLLPHLNPKSVIGGGVVMPFALEMVIAMWKAPSGCGKHNEQPDVGCQRFQIGCKSAGLNVTSQYSIKRTYTFYLILKSVKGRCAIFTLNLKWKQIEEHFHGLEKSLKSRFIELENQENEFKRKTTQSQQMLKKRQAAVMSKEEASLRRLQEKRDAAVVAIANVPRKRKSRQMEEQGSRPIVEEKPSDYKASKCKIEDMRKLSDIDANALTNRQLYFSNSKFRLDINERKSLRSAAKRGYKMFMNSSYRENNHCRVDAAMRMPQLSDFEKEKLRVDNERMAKEKESVVRVSLEIDSVAQWLTKFHGRRQLGYQANNRTSGVDYSGNGGVAHPVKDHDCWEKPEDMDTNRTVYTVHAPNAASDVAGEMEAALAASSIAFRQYQNFSDDNYLLLCFWNELLRIEEELGAEAVYAGANFRKPVEPY